MQNHKLNLITATKKITLSVIYSVAKLEIKSYEPKECIDRMQPSGQERYATDLWPIGIERVATA